MLYILAIFCPFLGVLLAGRPGRATFLIIMQMTVIGWLPAILIAWIMIGGAHADKRTKKIIKTINKNNV